MNRVLIFAGGVGSRMHTKDNRPKQFLNVNGKEIIVHTIEHFEKHKDIDDIVVVCVKGWEDHLKQILKEDNIKKVSKILTGGETGFDSRIIGLTHLVNTSDNIEEDIVLIHDGVRPLIDEKTITDNLRCTKKYGNAITYAPAVETIVYKDDNNKIINRSSCMLARAPQTFYLKDVYSYYLRAIEDDKTDIIDSASMADFYGEKLYFVEGPAENIKVTTPNDFYCVEGILKERQKEQDLNVGN